MKEFKEFIEKFSSNKPLEDIVTFFVDNEWFSEKLTLTQGKIYISDEQAELFTEKLTLFVEGTRDTLFKQFHKKFPETNRRFLEFLSELDEDFINNEDYRYYITDFMLYRLTKDLFLYSDNEMKILIAYATFDLIKAHGDILTFFIAWMRIHYKTSYKRDYVMNKRYTMEIQNQAYDFDEYIRLLYYLFVDEYIEENEMFKKAAESKNYTDTWLYLVLHFIRPLRLTDLERIPHPLLPFSSEDVLEKIKNNTFTNNDARWVLLTVTKNMAWLPLTPNKTKESDNVVPITFDIPVSCEVMLGKLFALAQAHRNIIGKSEEPIIRKISTYSEINRYMGPEIGNLFLHNDFRARSATKSFLQDIYMVANEEDSDNEEVYIKNYNLIALIRSHKGSYGEFARTTFEYLKDAKFSKVTPELVAFELLERGVFSFMASHLLKMTLGDKFDQLSNRNQTKLIKSMNLTPKEIESIVTVVDNANLEARKVISELITEDVDVLTVLHRIGSGIAYSKQRGCFCLMTALKKTCPYGTNRLCAECRYGLTTRTTLFALITEFNRCKEAYQTANNPLDKEKYKNIIQNFILPKMDEMLHAIKELYGEETFNEYETLIKENT